MPKQSIPAKRSETGQSRLHGWSTFREAVMTAHSGDFSVRIGGGFRMRTTGGFVMRMHGGFDLDTQLKPSRLHSPQSKILLRAKAISCKKYHKYGIAA
jgi:hypothetical protein